MVFSISEQIAVHSEHLSGYQKDLQQVQDVLNRFPKNRLAQMRFMLIQTSIELMIENIESLEAQLQTTRGTNPQIH